MIPETIVRQATSDAYAAPSSHNSQPWGLVWVRSKEACKRFRDALDQVGEDEGEYLIICLIPNRCLKALPAHHGEMLFSAGAFAENLVRSLSFQAVIINACQTPAAAAWHRFREVPDAWEPVTFVGMRRYDPARSKPEAPSCFHLRATYRGASAPSLPEGAVECSTDATSIAFPDAATLCELKAITRSEQLELLGKLVAWGGVRELTHRGAWAETYKFIRFTPRAEDGLLIDLLLARRLRPLQRFLMRLLMRLLMAPKIMSPLARAGAARMFARDLGASISSAPMALYAYAQSVDPTLRASLAAGALVEAAWLALAAKGVALRPVSVILQHDDLRRALVEQCELPAGRGLFFARAGVPLVQLPTSTRLSEGCQQLHIV